ncbi:hypothetical protein OOK27_19275 [Streptomyces canus]|uniref:hypothetical protein n=1 Tax=Streptomyces canus TaxID=58343 RepID=UPI00225BC529|nr:hypothetical protein [Streptomyces canus]MCX5256245.1 hypothetical protein [Streptomyces canus]
MNHTSSEASPGGARLLAVEQLREWGLPLHPAEHIVAELAVNAATHGRVPGRDFRLTLYVVGDTLRTRDALTAHLPTEPLHRPAALLAHRLTAQLPPPPPCRPPAPPPDVRHPFRNCDGCDRAFRAPAPGRCRDCRGDLPEAA